MLTTINQIKIYTLSLLKARYRGTIAGLLWVIINPILLYSIQAIVFKHILKLDVPNYSIFLLGGLLPWIFITSTVEMTSGTFINHAEFLKAIKMKPFVLIVSNVIDNFINFVIGFVLLLIYFVVLQKPSFSILLLPISLMNICVFVFLISWLVAFVTVFLRDLRFVISFVLNILFFATPIFYPKVFIPQDLSWVYELNFFYSFVEGIRSCIYQYDISVFMTSNLKSLLVNSSLFFINYFLWKKYRNEFYIRL